MFDQQTFIMRAHQKIIEHYRWLYDTAKSEAERERYQRRMSEEYEALNRYTGQQAPNAQRAA